MVRLIRLKPRVSALGSPLLTLAPGSWRAGKEGSTARGYGYRWQQARERHLRANPLCCYCERKGDITRATVVDHKVPHKGSEALFWDETNWQSLCKPCHDGEKAREERSDGGIGSLQGHET